ncbi:MAG: V-type ATP synthase subunit B, partial [Kiritimatiellae bacterium]|nr:V-type ATP synthase subunit B [Kiritimatiellia bacterium]
MNTVYHRIDSSSGSVVTLRAPGVTYHELAEISSRGRSSLAQVIKIDGEKVSLQVFAGARGIATDARVRFLGRPMQVSFSEDLLGRVFDGAGVPRDGGPALSDCMIDIGGPSVNPARRIVPRNMVRTNIPMIDVFNSL